MRVLVTGCDGYIGSLLAAALIADGHAVTGYDNGMFADGRLVPYQTTFPVIRKDIRDVEAGDVQDFDAVMHLAGLSNDPLGHFDPKLTFEINYAASVRLAELAKRSGVRRFLFSSSCSLYGQGDSGALSESARFDPQTPYAESKVRAEEDIRLLASSGFSPIFLRNATAYGISPRQRFDLVLPNLCAWAHTTGQIRLNSDGSAWRPLVHIADICAAFLSALTAPIEAIHNQAFNVGRDEDNYTVRAIAEAVANEFIGSRITYATATPNADTRNYNVSFAKIHSTLSNHRPHWRMGDGIRECAFCYREIGLDWATFQDRKYNRLMQLQYLLEKGLLEVDLRLARGHRGKETWLGNDSPTQCVSNL